MPLTDFPVYAIALSATGNITYPQSVGVQGETLRKGLRVFCVFHVYRCMVCIVTENVLLIFKFSESFRESIHTIHAIMAERKTGAFYHTQLYTGMK